MSRRTLAMSLLALGVVTMLVALYLQYGPEQAVLAASVLFIIGGILLGLE